MPSTLVHAVLPAVCVASRKQFKDGLTRFRLWCVIVVCSVIANMPDLDVLGVIVWPDLSSLIHRSVGHNVFALAVWVILGRWLLSWVSPTFTPLRAYVYSLSLVTSHVFLDAGCQHAPGVPAGVPLLWPLSDWELTAPIPIFADYHLNLGHDWFLGHILASDYWTRAIFQEVVVSSILFVVFVMVSLLTSWFLRQRSRLPSRLTQSP